MQLPSFPLVEWFAAAEGNFEISLSHSDCEPLAVSDILDADELQTLSTFPLKYGNFAGAETLREAVAAQYSTIEKDDVLIFSGTSETIYTFMRTNLSPGDEVVVQTPCYHALAAIAASIGCRVVEWKPEDDKSCIFEAKKLDQLCSPSTRLVVINFPHNPSGQLITVDALESIVETVKRYDALLFSDESFRLLELPCHATLPAACDLYNNAVSVTGVSKTHGLGGLRIGWMASRCKQMIQSAKQFRFYTTEMTNTPCQFLAAAAIKRSEEVIAQNRSRISKNLKTLESFCNKHGRLLQLHRPQAGTMALVEQKTSMTSTMFCQKLLGTQKVFLIPGAAMGLSDRLVRFGIGRIELEEGLKRIDQFLRKVS